MDVSCQATWHYSTQRIQCYLTFLQSEHVETEYRFVVSDGHCGLGTASLSPLQAQPDSSQSPGRAGGSTSRHCRRWEHRGAFARSHVWQCRRSVSYKSLPCHLASHSHTDSPPARLEHCTGLSVMSQPARFHPATSLIFPVIRSTARH